MIDELIARVKQMYYQLDQDQMRYERLATENFHFGVTPPPTTEAFQQPTPPVPPSDGTSPTQAPPVQPEAPAAGPPPTSSMLDVWGQR